MSPTGPSDPLIIFDRHDALFTRGAPPTFASREESPSALLFVDVTTKKSQSEKRRIRAHIMHASHEAKRRQALEVTKRISSSPLQDASFASVDPFDSLPVKTIPGVHELVVEYFAEYPGCIPLADDRWLRSQDPGQAVTARRSNTQWDMICSDETCLLSFLSGFSRLHITFNPDPPRERRANHLRAKQELLRSIRERLPTARTKPSEISGAYVFAIICAGCSEAMYTDDPALALSHLHGALELIRLRGGIDAFDRIARRGLIWGEFHICAAHQLRPTLVPPLPPPWDDSSPTATTTTTSPSSSRSSASKSPAADAAFPSPPSSTSSSPSSSSSPPSSSSSPPPPSPFPPHFRAFLAAIHARTTALLPSSSPSLSPSPTSSDPSAELSRIFAALTLVSLASTTTWAPIVHADGPTREAVAAVLDDATYRLLVLCAVDDGDDGDGDGVGNADGEGDGEEEGEEEGDEEDATTWAQAVLLNAANAYVWAELSEIFTGTKGHSAMLRRLRRVLEGGVGVVTGPLSGPSPGEGGGQGGGGGARGGVFSGALSVEAHMWALVVGWTLAEGLAAASEKLRGTSAKEDEMVGWFEDRVVELLREARIGEIERAAELVRDFPGTDAFWAKWHRLLLGDRFRGRRWQGSVVC